MELNKTDIIVIILFFLSMLGIGLWSYFKNKNAEDYYVAGGKMPWWLAGVSHHVSGHSGAVFVAYAAIAFTHGFTIYIWWAFTIGVAIILSAKVFPVYWVRLRKKLQIQSPLEYLATRYNILTQQIIAWIGVILKVFDVGAKWAAISILLNVVAGIPMTTGILVSGVVSLIYVTFGGLWGVMVTDFLQFLVQIIGGIVMFVLVVEKLGGWGAVTGIWHRLPPEHSRLFNDPYTFGFALAFLYINFLSFNGGSWSLATRYISSPDERHASRAALLSGILYLVWPLILFFPMWASPLLLPASTHPPESYARLMVEILPQGMIGLVIASLFASTMAMTSSDVNTLSAVITRDILPVVSGRFRNKINSLQTARITTFIYTLLTLVIALQYEHFGGVLGLIVYWFGAMIGPIAVPVLFGLLPAFRSCGPRAAILSIFAGLSTFIITKSVTMQSMAWEVSLPLLVSSIVYCGASLFNRRTVPEKVELFLDRVIK